MAKPNYGYEKRQRELAKKNKKEEKLRRKAQQGQEGAADDVTGVTPVDDTQATGPATESADAPDGSPSP